MCVYYSGGDTMHAMFSNFISHYVFRESANIGGFGEAMTVDLFLPGPASLVNHHSALDNGRCMCKWACWRRFILALVDPHSSAIIL